jgi:PadR family transcriptional regulator PadR
MNYENTRSQMRKGTLEYCILLVLSKQDAYAPDIITVLKKANLIVVEGTLYPLLTRLKNAGLLTYRWEESPYGPPRKYYSITDKGRLFLNELNQSWDELVAAIEHIRKWEGK